MAMASFLKDFQKRFLFDREITRQKAFMRTIPIFAGLRGRELGRLIQSLYLRTYQKDEVLFSQGDIGRALFILESGRVDLIRLEPDGSEETIYAVKPGEFFGEMALLEERPRTASAKAAESSKLYLLYRTELDELVHSAPRIAAIIFRHLAERLSGRLRERQDLRFSETALSRAS